MLCPNCGREIPDGTVCPCMGGSSALSSNPAVNVIKSIGSSTIFLVLAILSTVSVVLSVITDVTTVSSGVPEYLYDIYNSMGIDPSVYASAVSSGSVSSAISIVVSIVLSSLTTIALWLHYFTCKNQNSGNISTAGLTILKVFTWISIVSVIIVCVCMVILMVALMALGGSLGAYYDSPEAAGLTVGLIVFLLILLGALLGLMLAYEIAMLRVINRAKTIAYNGIPDNRVSQFLIVMSYLMGGFSCLVALISLFGSPLSGIAGLASGAASILTGVCLSRYRKEMTAVMYPPVQPVYAAQPVQPAAPVQPTVPVQPAAPAQPPVAPVEQPAAPAEQSAEEPAPTEPKE